MKDMLGMFSDTFYQKSLRFQEFIFILKRYWDVCNETLTFSSVPRRFVPTGIFCGFPVCAFPEKGYTFIIVLGG